MDWRAALHYTLIAGVIVVGVALAVLLFNAVFLQVGVIAAVLLVAIGILLLKRWDERRTVKDRERLEHIR